MKTTLEMLALEQHSPRPNARHVMEMVVTGAIRPGEWLFMLVHDRGILYVADEDRTSAVLLWPDAEIGEINNSSLMTSA